MENNRNTSNKTEYEPQHKASSLFFVATCLSITSSFSYIFFNLNYLLVSSSILSIGLLLFAIYGGATFMSTFGPKPTAEMELDLPIFILVNLSFLSSISALLIEVFIRGGA